MQAEIDAWNKGNDNTLLEYQYAIQMQNTQSSQTKQKNTAGQGNQTLGRYEGIFLHSAFKIKLVNVKIYKKMYRLYVLSSK